MSPKRPRIAEQDPETAAKRRAQLAQAKARYKARRAGEIELERAENEALGREVKKLAAQLEALQGQEKQVIARPVRIAEDQVTDAFDESDLLLKHLLVEHALYFQAILNLNVPLSLSTNFMMINRQSAQHIIDTWKFECLRLLAESNQALPVDFDPHDKARFSAPLQILMVPGLSAHLRYAVRGAGMVRINVECDPAPESNASTIMGNLIQGLMNPEHTDALAPPAQVQRLATSSWSRWTQPLDDANTKVVHAVHRVDASDEAEMLHVAIESLEDCILSTFCGMSEPMRHGIVKCHSLHRLGASRPRPRNEGEAITPSAFDAAQGFFIWNEGPQVRAVIVARVPIVRGGGLKTPRSEMGVKDIVSGNLMSYDEILKDLGRLITAMCTKPLGTPACKVERQHCSAAKGCISSSAHPVDEIE